MPGEARIVMPGVAHHVTQKTTNRHVVFLSQSDRKVYLDLLRENSRTPGVSILAYCLMPNHIHPIAEPVEKLALATMLRRVQGRYAQYFNARKQRSGHLWQNRFYSCPLERTHLWNALAYVERNPVRSGLVDKAEDFSWSSAAAHLGGKDALRALDMEFWREVRAARLLGRTLATGRAGDVEARSQADNFCGEGVGIGGAFGTFREAEGVGGAEGFAKFAVWRIRLSLSLSHNSQLGVSTK